MVRNPGAASLAISLVWTAPVRACFRLIRSKVCKKRSFGLLNSTCGEMMMFFPSVVTSKGVSI